MLNIYTEWWIMGNKRPEIIFKKLEIFSDVNNRNLNETLGKKTPKKQEE